MTDSLFNPDEVIEQLDTEALAEKYSQLPQEELVKKAINADLHINKIEAENSDHRTHSQQLRDQLAERINMEKFLERLQASNTSNPPPAPQPDTVKDKGLTKEDVESLLANNEARRTAEGNVSTVKTELTKNYGPNYAEKILAKLSELGMSQQEFTSLAASKPQAALKLVTEVKAPTEVLRQPVSTVNTTNLNNRTGVKNKAYFDKLRQTNFSQYNSIETQNELMAEAIRQGDSFYS